MSLSSLLRYSFAVPSQSRRSEGLKPSGSFCVQPTLIRDKVVFSGKNQAVSPKDGTASITADASKPSIAMSSLETLSMKERGKVRQYCLDQIKETYNFDYNPQWHADLDKLTSERVEESLYHPDKKGHFVVAKDEKNSIVGAAGLQQLNDRRPDLFQRFFSSFSPRDIGSVWRVYVRKDAQGKGFGKRLSEAIEEKAWEYGYKALYLQADSHTAMNFWKKRKYELSAEDRSDALLTLHMQKKLKSSDTHAPSQS